MEDKNDKLIRLATNALWRCKAPFSKEDIIKELEKENIELKDFDKFKELFKDVLIEDNGLYRIDITKVFNEMYKK